MRFYLTMVACVVSTIALLANCTTSAPKPYQHQKTSIIRFLGPVESQSDKQGGAKPTITVPLKVGITFVPASGFGSFPEEERMQLINKIAAQFEEYKFVESIERIPSLYLDEGGGFENLDRLRQLFGIDIIMLLSYDQSQFKDTGASAIWYWTLVGAYVVKGEKNDTHTLMDASLFHVASRNMLFRASGTNHIKSSATPINLSAQARKDRLAGFQNASIDLANQLEQKLHHFRKMIRSSSGAFELILKPGYTLDPLDAAQ